MKELWPLRCSWLFGVCVLPLMYSSIHFTTYLIFVMPDGELSHVCNSHTVPGDVEKASIATRLKVERFRLERG